MPAEAPRRNRPKDLDLFSNIYLSIVRLTFFFKFHLNIISYSFKTVVNYVWSYHTDFIFWVAQAFKSLQGGLDLSKRSGVPDSSWSMRQRVAAFSQKGAVIVHIVEHEEHDDWYPVAFLSSSLASASLLSSLNMILY